jgi:hypothetical protein
MRTQGKSQSTTQTTAEGMLVLMRSLGRFLPVLIHSVIVRLLFAVSTIVSTLVVTILGCILIVIGAVIGGAILMALFPALEGAVMFLARFMPWLLGIFAVWNIISSGAIRNVYAAFTESGPDLSRRIAIQNWAKEVVLNNKRGSTRGLHATHTMPRREAIPHYIKEAVYSRDGGACQHCGSMNELEYDHVIPISKGGSNGVNNVQLLCFDCNRRKGNRYVY